MKRMIMVVLALVVLAGCATTDEHRDPYGEQVKCSTCDRWYDGVVKSDPGEPDGEEAQADVCAECGRVLPEVKGLDLSGLPAAFFMAHAIIYGGMALVIAIFALALG